MAVPAVLGDMVQGNCLPGTHQTPAPNGGPQPNPIPVKYTATLADKLAKTVTIGGKKVALVDSITDSRLHHVGLHASDPTQVNARMQIGTVATGSPTVTIEGNPVATSASTVKTCGGTATIQTTVPNVTVA